VGGRARNYGQSVPVKTGNVVCSLSRRCNSIYALITTVLSPLSTALARSLAALTLPRHTGTGGSSGPL